MLKKFDTHHHLWKYTPSDYPWIDGSMELLKKDYLLSDLSKLLADYDVIKTIVVQARQTLVETDWLLELAGSSHLIAGVTGWLPLTDSSIDDLLWKYAENPLLLALRHVLQDEPDPLFLEREDVNYGISLLHSHSLLYEILIYHHQLPQTVRFVDRHPNQLFILDHGGKPNIALGEILHWREWITELGKRETVYCKVSGLMTEAKWNGWSFSELEPYLDTLWEAFGSDRLLFGSDWPVCLVAGTYGQWVTALESYTNKLTPDEQQKFYFDNAQAIYQKSGSGRR
jgi:L-fuconolactonase